MSTKESILIRTILGPIRSEVRTLACAVREAERLMFDAGTPMDDICVTKDIYPFVAKSTKKSSKAVARQIERVGNLCWDSMDERQEMKYIGKVYEKAGAPREMIFFLAFYCRFGKPFYEVLSEQPSLLFGIKDKYLEA